ncbi:MAG: hypothetical protein M1457_07160 [bacterium]|nr:hypothetical protein [bacterium]
MATLEATNWWPLSLVAYWRRGSVMTMPGNDGQLYYMVSQTRGYGPLSLIYLSQEDAAFDTQGKRLTHMTGRAVMMGCLAMSHEMESRLDPDTWMTHKTLHLIHHLINISDMDGMTNVSLFTAPNPIGYGH